MHSKSIFIIDFKVETKIQLPIPWKKRILAKWFPKIFSLPVPEYHYDVVFRTRMIEWLKPGFILQTETGVNMLVNRIENSFVYAQTMGFIVEENFDPKAVNIKGFVTRESNK